MADYAVMPYTDYEDACNAVREKTGGTANIKSGEMGAQIRAIDTQEDLSEELTAQDTAIAEQDTKIAELLAALEGKAVPSAPEVVTGVYTLAANASESITIPGLVGKENFSLAFHGDLDLGDSMMLPTMIHCRLIAETSDDDFPFYYEYVYPASGGLFSGNAYVDSESSTHWDSSTGTLTRETIPYRFPAGDWYYIGW